MKYWQKNMSQCTLLTYNCTWFVLGLNPALRGDRPAHLYVLGLINLINATATARITLQITAVQQPLVFENWRFVLPEDGTRVPKSV
jgi:hypothetical protein